MIQDNEDDTVTLKTNFLRDPDQERKTMLLKHVGITSQTVHYLRHGYIPDPLLTTMRVMAMNPTEVDFCYQLADQEELKFKEPLPDHVEVDDDEEDKRDDRTLAGVLQFLSVRNEIAMLDLLDMLLGTKLQRILEWDTKLSTPPQNQAQEFAYIYREGRLYEKKGRKKNWRLQKRLDPYPNDRCFAKDSYVFISVVGDYRSKTDLKFLYRNWTGHDVQATGGNLFRPIEHEQGPLYETGPWIQSTDITHGSLHL